MCLFLGKVRRKSNCFRSRVVVDLNSDTLSLYKPKHIKLIIEGVRLLCSNASVTPTVFVT